MKDFGFSAIQPQYLDYDTYDGRILNYVLEKNLHLLYVCRADVVLHLAVHPIFSI